MQLFTKRPEPQTAKECFDEANRLFKISGRLFCIALFFGVIAVVLRVLLVFIS